MRELRKAAREFSSSVEQIERLDEFEDDDESDVRTEGG